ncbi:MAG: hypothetical protein AB7I18_15065 [Candidatus Berkiella sp.]
MTRIPKPLPTCQRYLNLNQLDDLERLLDHMTQYKDSRTVDEMQEAMSLCQDMLEVYHKAGKIDTFVVST